MRCVITSRAGQVIAKGTLYLSTTESGEQRLDLKTDGGRVLEGGLVGADGDLSVAGQTLFDQFFSVWGMTGLVLTITIR